MADSSCSHWWHAPFYVSMAVVLAFISLATVNHTSPENPLPSIHSVTLNASQALHRCGGFHITAALLQISPEIFFSGKETTIFAIHDSALSNLSIPPWELRRLLQDHIAVPAFPMAELAKKPPGFCLTTLVKNKNLVVTEKDPKTGAVTINNLLITHPDLFLQNQLSIHGVATPFAAIPLPGSCNFSSPGIPWNRIIRNLSSKGFISFAIGLNTALDGILKDHKNLNSITIFAPPNPEFIYSTSPLMGRVVRIHILPQRLSEKQLLNLQNKSLTTLVPEYKLKIHEFSRILRIDNVEVTAPDLVSHEKFVIHGISGDFISENHHPISSK